MNNKRGFILILTFMFMVALTLMVMGFLFMAAYEVKDTGAGGDDMELLYLADAGVERAYRALRDNYATTTQTGIAVLRGGDTTSSIDTGTAMNPTNMYYIDNVSATIDTTYNNNPLTGEQAIIRTFDSNYANTRIISIVPYVGAGRATGGSGATLQFAYTTDGANYTTVLTQVLPNSTNIVLYPGTAIAGLTWAQITSPNFRLRSIRTAGNKNILVDYMYLLVTYGIDTLTESWNNASYTALFPITLGSGTIQSAVMTDEAAKIHLNYASQALIQNLLTNIGGIANAATKATDIVNYRGAGLTNPFDSVEELQRVGSITAADYAAVRNYFTVYSFINSNSNRPTAARAPVNINTAPFVVLKAIFDPLTLGAGDSTSLANDIISTRTTPFTCFYSSSSTTDFFDFVNARAYLTATERLEVLNNASAAILPPNGGTGTVTGLRTTEFCYAGTAFNINSLARVNNRNFRVNTIRGSSGARTFTNFVGDTTSVGYRAENFE